jgi:hypothetical protein
MPKLFLRSKSVPRRRKIRITKLQSTSDTKTSRNLRSSRRLKELEKKRKEKSSVYVSSRRRQLTDRLKSMP